MEGTKLMATRKAVHTPKPEGYREDKTYAKGTIMYRCDGCAWNTMDEKLMRQHVAAGHRKMTTREKLAALPASVSAHRSVASTAPTSPGLERPSHGEG